MALVNGEKRIHPLKFKTTFLHNDSGSGEGVCCLFRLQEDKCCPTSYNAWWSLTPFQRIFFLVIFVVSDRPNMRRFFLRVIFLSIILFKLLKLIFYYSLVNTIVVNKINNTCLHHPQKYTKLLLAAKFRINILAKTCT